MPASKKGAALVALTFCLLTGARADELLVMPYACAVFGGSTVLTPGPEVGHRILGPREERRFSACSPVNPGLCRQWTVYRFDLDCDGDRVPWVSVVAAAGEKGRNARLVNGRLQLRMPPRWSLPPDDPCAEEPDPDDRFAYRRMRRYCADRMAISPPMVEMPAGFAPMLGIDGIFVKAAPKVAASPPPLPPVAAAPPPDGPAGPPQKAAQPQPWSEALVAKEPSAQPPPPNSGTDAMPASKGAPIQPPPATAAPKAAAPTPQPPPKVALAPPAPSKEGATLPPRTEPEGKTISLNLFSALRPATAGAIVVFAGLALGLVIAFAMARRREGLAHAGRRQREFASLSFDDPHADERMPATRAEALQVLGMAPSANLAAIKKIVDGLRVSWHPDLASDEADRRLRELRSKQINAAWEILQRQRADI